MVISKYEEWQQLEEEKDQLKEEMQNKCYEDCLQSNCSTPSVSQRRMSSNSKLMGLNVVKQLRMREKQ